MRSFAYKVPVAVDGWRWRPLLDFIDADAARASALGSTCTPPRISAGLHLNCATPEIVEMRCARRFPRTR